MKKIFNKVASVVGVTASVAVLLIVLYVALFSINESTGKSIAGTTKTFKGTITGISCSKTNYDISFTIDGQKKSYYINRGVQKFDCEVLRNKLLNKEVEISHVVFFNNASSGHINQLCYNGEKVYSELH